VVQAVYHSDGLGSVRALTDAAGTLAQTYHTDAFGVPSATQGISSQRFGFTGEQVDPSGLVYLRARMYDPAIGRFIQRDTMFGWRGDSARLNRYGYATNNPLAFTDPSGHSAVQTAKAMCEGSGWACDDLTHDMAVELINGNATEIDPFDPSVLANGSPIDKAAFLISMVGTGGGGIRARILADIGHNGVRITDTVAARIAVDPHRFIPPSVVQSAVTAGRMFNDPQGASHAVAFFTTVVRNGNEVGVKVVYDVANNTVLHMHFDAPQRILKQLERAGEILGH